MLSSLSKNIHDALFCVHEQKEWKETPPIFSPPHTPGQSLYEAYGIVSFWRFFLGMQPFIAIVWKGIWDYAWHCLTIQQGWVIREVVVDWLSLQSTGLWSHLWLGLGCYNTCIRWGKDNVSICCGSVDKKDRVADMHVGGQTAPQNTFNKWNEGRGCLHEWKAFVFPSQKILGEH